MKILARNNNMALVEFGTAIVCKVIKLAKTDIEIHVVKAVTNTPMYQPILNLGKCLNSEGLFAKLIGKPLIEGIDYILCDLPVPNPSGRDDDYRAWHRVLSSIGVNLTDKVELDLSESFFDEHHSLVNEIRNYYVDKRDEGTPTLANLLTRLIDLDNKARAYTNIPFGATLLLNTGGPRDWTLTEEKASFSIDVSKHHGVTFEIAREVMKALRALRSCDSAGPDVKIPAEEGISVPFVQVKLSSMISTLISWKLAIRAPQYKLPLRHTTGYVSSVPSQQGRLQMENFYMHATPILSMPLGDEAHVGNLGIPGCQICTGQGYYFITGRKLQGQTYEAIKTACSCIKQDVTRRD